MLDEFSEYFRNLELEDPDSTCGTSDYDTSFDDDPDDCYCEEYNKTGETEKFHKELKKELFADRVKNIHNKYEADKRPPTGNQNCLLCSWCAEAYFRGKDVLPRPVYSPRDPVLFVDPASIVFKATSYIFENMRELMECIDKPNTRWYVHVKWEGGTGGHEFLIINMNNIPEIVDAQQGLIEPVTNLKVFNDYFGNIDWHESHAFRLDDRAFNKEVFNKCNDPSTVVPWDAKLDIPYMLEHGMLSEEEAEQYWKEHPDEAPNDRHFLSYEELDRMSESKNIFTSGDFRKYGKDVDLNHARGPITESTVMEFDLDSEKDLPSNVFTLNEYKKASSYRSLIVGEIHDLSMIDFYNKLLSERKPEFFISELVHEDRVLDQNDLKAALDMATDGEFKRGVPDYQDNYAIYKLAYDHGCKLIGCDLYSVKHYNRMNDEDADREAFMLKVLEEFENTNFVCQLGDHHLRSIPISKEFLDFCGDTTDDRGIVSDLTVDNASPIWTHFKNSKYVAILREPNELKNELEFTNQQHIQEGAWNDIKNGVNPYSKKLWFHVSRSDKHEGKVFTPRVPDYLYTQEELGKDDPYYEDMTIPRICFSPSIEGALHAIISMGDRIGTAGEEFYVYIPEKPINEYKHMTNKEIVDKKLVFDAKYTKECWITEPVKLILYGSIAIDQVYNHRRKPTANGKSNVGVVSYKWHWQTKPQVVKGTGHEAFAWNEEPKQKSKKKSKSIKEAFEMSNLERDPSVIKMFLESEKDDENEDTSTDITVTDVEIGTDDGTGEQNQYDPEEVEYLNHLIAAEAEAISDYFEGGKKTKVPVLGKLYSDIGEEERFHLEQLIYAKSTITGEKYEPKDPDVRKEYEELRKLGMDEQTAMTTAVDKLSISVKEEEPDTDMTDEEIDDIKESFELIYSVSQSTSLQTQIMLESVIDQKQIRRDIIESTNAFFEQVFVMEEVSNLNTKAGQNELGSKNPIVMILKAISGIYRLVISLVKKAKLAFQKTRLKSKAKWAWIKKHGIKGLFADGVSMYFYSDKKMKYDIGDALKYLKLINDTCDIIIRDTGIKNVDQNKYKIDKYIEKLKASTPDVDSFTINTLDEGISKLNGSNLFKVKMIVNDNNEKEIEEQFFGYTEKNFLAITKEGENSKQINLSNNIYNKMDIILNAFNLCTAKSVEIATGLNALSEKPNTIFQSNPKLFNKCVSALSVISKSLNKFTSAVSSDLASMMNLNKGLNELARRYEETHSKEDKQKLGEYTKGRADAKQQADAAEKSNDKTQSKYNV